MAAKNLELVAHHAEAAGILRSESAGWQSDSAGAPGQRDARSARRTRRTGSARRRCTRAPGAPGAPVRCRRANANALSFTNSDIAFRGTHMFIGNYHGINMYDIERADRPRLLASIVCPGGQGDVSIHGNLLFMSVEQTRGRLDCGMQGVNETVSAERFRGVRIFDISNLRNPKQVAAIQTCRGSHTHTLVTDPKDKANIYVYGSGTGAVRQGEELAGCVPDRRIRTPRSSAST